jgi:bifunctional UDP-N-acetylglucosamine pyrophosphorylase/glucosamine-1-phosphate N-acetyltransferase
MRSKLPKLLHPICEQSMLSYSLSAMQNIGKQKPILVVGHAADQVRENVGDAADFAIQEEQRGTGHAVLQAREAVGDESELVLVANADLPLLKTETLVELISIQENDNGAFALLTVRSDNPRGFGRIKRDTTERGAVSAIVEEAEANDEEKRIDELNVGVYCFDANWLWPALERIVPAKNTGEYYLTDLVELANQDGLQVSALQLEDPNEAIGVNTRAHLAQAEAAMQKRINERHMLAGVSMKDPRSAFIGPHVEIGPDSTILPNTTLEGDTKIGSDSIIGPNAIIRESQIGDGCHIEASVIEFAIIEDEVDVGPFSHMRKGAHLGKGVHIGNYAEVKNSRFGANVKMGHFSYIGDAQIGENTNIGAGTITANYDGENKNSTEIGKNVFIGSDTMLVAPLKIGDGARTGAGAVVTKDVAENMVVVGIPARAIRKVDK